MTCTVPLQRSVIQEGPCPPSISSFIHSSSFFLSFFIIYCSELNVCAFDGMAWDDNHDFLYSDLVWQTVWRKYISQGLGLAELSEGNVSLKEAHQCSQLNRHDEWMKDAFWHSTVEKWHCYTRWNQKCWSGWNIYNFGHDGMSLGQDRTWMSPFLGKME